MPTFDRRYDGARLCPACSSRGLEHFYQVDGVPTSSNLLMATRQEAMDWPRGNVHLAVCHHCGFVTNTAFDPATQKLTARYEATQACSPTFGSFARQLAQSWIDRYSLRGRKILEIGCGQGEFIAMMCEMANARGFGIDPIIDPSRTPKTDRVTFLADEFGARHASLAADFIVCRHTLEHIADVSDFVGTIHATIADRPDAVLAIEVPDTRRVLAEGAFWDIYYEHCSYFDGDSLSTPLRAVGFEILNTRLEYRGQYLIVECRPASAPPRLHSVTSPAAANSDTSRIAAKLSFWQTFLADRANESTVIWGSGSKAVGFLTTLGIRDEVAAVIDINPAKHGTFLPGSGHEIIAPAKLRALAPRNVIVMNPIYRSEVQDDLQAMGVVANTICLE